MTHRLDAVSLKVLKLLLWNVSCTGPSLPILIASTIFQIFNQSYLDYYNSFPAAMA